MTKQLQDYTIREINWYCIHRKESCIEQNYGFMINKCPFYDLCDVITSHYMDDISGDILEQEVALSDTNESAET